MRGTNPFPGLRPFEANESHLFFGREAAIDDLLGKLRNNRFIAVVGTSGSGKSSLVRAGMLPDLYGGVMASAGSSWRVAVLRPGDAPIIALAEALVAPEVFGAAGMEAAIVEVVLRRGALGLVEVTGQARMADGENLLIVVDQFEELFRFKESADELGFADEAAAFVKLLLKASRQDSLPVYIIITMRSEYLGDCTQFRDLPEAINAGQYLIPRMTRDQRSKAITGPIAVGGGIIAPRLLQRLLNDVGDNPDQLPIMQHAMMRTWDHWAAESVPEEGIDIHHYEATGGMNDALSRHADEAYNELPDVETKTLAERLFKRLTGKGTDNREMRFPARIEDLCQMTGAELEQIVDIVAVFRRQGRSFLMPPPDVVLSPDTLIDISHESLIRIWSRLKKWVEEEAQSARIYRRLAETAALHETGQAGLWRDPDLQIALVWRARNHPSGSWAARYHAGFKDAMAFLEKSHSAARRRRVLAMVPFVLLPVVLVAFGINWILQAWQEDRKRVDVLANELQSTEDELQTTIVIASQLADQKDSLRADSKNRLKREKQQLGHEITQTAENLQQEQKQKETLRALLGNIKTELDGLSVESQQAEQLGERLDKAVEELDTQISKKRQRLKAKLADTVNELYSVSEKEAKIEVEHFAIPDPGNSDLSVSELNHQTPNSSANSLAEDREGKEQVVIGDSATISESVMFNALEDGSSSGSLDGVAGSEITRLEDLGSKDKLTIRQQLDILRHSLEDTGNIEEKTQAQSKIQGLEEVIASSASIVSQENFVTCKNVDKLEPVGEVDRFSPGRVYTFARVHAPRDETLALVWNDDSGKELRRRELKVKRNEGRGFRTFSYWTLQERGAYEVRLYNQDRYLIAYRRFLVD
jgi:energy-coupling factor transporter ATP-binding protein EcfA2